MQEGFYQNSFEWESDLKSFFSKITTELGNSETRELIQKLNSKLREVETVIFDLNKSLFRGEESIIEGIGAMNKTVKNEVDSLALQFYKLKSEKQELLLTSLVSHFKNSSLIFESQEERFRALLDLPSNGTNTSSEQNQTQLSISQLESQKRILKSAVLRPVASVRKLETPSLLQAIYDLKSKLNPAKTFSGFPNFHSILLQIVETQQRLNDRISQLPPTVGFPSSISTLIRKISSTFSISDNPEVISLAASFSFHSSLNEKTEQLLQQVDQSSSNLIQVCSSLNSKLKEAELLARVNDLEDFVQLAQEELEAKEVVISGYRSLLSNTEVKESEIIKLISSENLILKQKLKDQQLIFLQAKMNWLKELAEIKEVLNQLLSKKGPLFMLRDSVKTLGIKKIKNSAEEEASRNWEKLRNEIGQLNSSIQKWEREKRERDEFFVESSELVKKIRSAEYIPFLKKETELIIGQLDNYIASISALNNRNEIVKIDKSCNCIGSLDELRAKLFAFDHIFEEQQTKLFTSLQTNVSDSVSTLGVLRTSVSKLRESMENFIKKHNESMIDLRNIAESTLLTVDRTSDQLNGFRTEGFTKFEDISKKLVQLSEETKSLTGSLADVDLKKVYGKLNEIKMMLI